MTIDLLLFLLCLISILFYSYGIYAAIAFRRQSDSVDSQFQPAITILKPLCGLELDIYENLSSFCQQDYPNYQIVFAVRDRQDPSIEIVEKIRRDFPNIDIDLVVSDRVIGANLKVSNLANAVSKAKHEILVIADSDIRVGKDYLSRIIQPLQNENVGVVTCLYRSSSGDWVTTLEAIGTATDSSADILVSNQLGAVSFAFGSTTVIRRQVLETIGGFDAIADYLADDYQLGYLPSQAGYQVVLSNYVVEHVLGNSTLINSLHRQIRWAKCIRVSRPWGYLSLIFTYGTVTSLLFLLATGESKIAIVMMAITWVLRLIMGWFVGAIVLEDKITQKFWWLIPIYDLIHFAIWCYACIGQTIEWRGEKLKLITGGKLVAIEH